MLIQLEEVEVIDLQGIRDSYVHTCNGVCTQKEIN